MKFPVKKAPIWSTSIKTSTSGKESRAAFWSYPRWKYSLSYDLLRSDAVNLELQQLLGFFNARNGSFDDWLFSDPDDSAVVTQPFGTGDGTTTQFQLVRSLGGYSEPVKALNGAPQIFKAGVLQTSGTHYSISATGLVTFVTAPAAAAALTWSGAYYWRCRFMEDSISPEKFLDKLWELSALEFISVK